MIDPTSAIAGLSALAKTVADIASSNDAAQRNALLIEFQKALIQTQGITASEQRKNASLAARNQELEQEIVRLKDWAAERDKYELKEVATGIFARVEKSYVGPLKSAQKFCANCFEQREKRILQFQNVEVGRKKSLVCGHCKSTVVFHSYADET